MIITSVVPKGFIVTTEFTLQQIVQLRDYLKRSKVDYDSEKEPELVDAIAYVVKGLYPQIDDLCESIEKGGA